MTVYLYLAGLMATIVSTLLAKYVWDRWLSATSRVTEQRCKDNQAVCFLKVVAKIDKLTEDLTCGDATFAQIKTYQEKTTHTLRLILMTLAEICTSGEGCEDRTKERLRQEMLK